jgi:DNA recombination protein RmuC
MIPILLITVLVLLVAVLTMQILLLRRGAVDLSPLQLRLEAADKGHERTERTVREEIGRSRDESGTHARELRGEVGSSLKLVGDSVLQNLGEMTRAQQAQFEGFLGALTQMAESQQGNARQLREEVGNSVKRLTDSNETRLEALRGTVEAKLQHIRDDNGKQLEQMRATVDEKLQGTLEQRLGESFRLVSEQLKQVHNGLGEMQSLASGVGDLKRVLTNVKVRGTWGEVQLGTLLDQVLIPEQYAANVATREGSAERVEFAIRLPGRGDGEGETLLPIDAKFPQEDYQRLVEAQESGDTAGVETAGKALEQRIRQCARDICAKYLNPPRTTDFGILFLPTEGLYAEVIRRTGLVEVVQRECRVVIAGPTTLAALLNSLQMGFRTLAIQQRSSEVWNVLGAVKTEFGKFGVVLDKVKKKLDEASNVVDQAQTRRRAVERNLRSVEALPTADAERLLLGTGVDGITAEDAPVAEEWEAAVSAS